MEYSHDETHFSNSNCDVCGLAGPTVMHYSNGAPVLTQCKACAPKEYDRVARQVGMSPLPGTTYAFGR